MKDRAECELEVEALKKIRPKPNLITLLTTFQYQENYCLLFHWAEGGNLWDLWLHHNPGPAIDKSWVCWLAEQCFGLADGLCGIHNAKISIDELQNPLPSLSLTLNSYSGNDEDEKYYGRHGDIKPRNILWFRNESNKWGHGTLKITNFGVTEFHTEHTTKLFANRVRGVTLTYMAPEYDLNQHISRPYDIWSLGCLYLEFVVWAVCGGEGVSKFGEERMSEKDSRKIFEMDTFYGLFRQNRSQPAHAEVKRSVIRVRPSPLHSPPPPQQKKELV